MTQPENWGIVGHEWAVGLLQRALEQEALSHAYLFVGPSGVGKTTLALGLTSALLCETGSLACGSCRPCRLLESGNHPDVHNIGPESAVGRIKIEQVRELQRQLSLTPHLGRHRVAILERFEQATPSAANALLKMLEEPPPYVLLILLVSSADALLPTIVSRCQPILLRPLAPLKVQQALEERWGVEAERAHLLAHLCGGCLGWAIQAATDPATLERRDRRLDDLVVLLGAPLVERFRYAAELTRDPVMVEEALRLWTGWWRDVMLVAGGAKESLTNKDRQDLVSDVAGRVGVRAAAQLVTDTLAAAERLRRNANPLLTLEVFLGFDLPRL